MQFWSLLKMVDLFNSFGVTHLGARLEDLPVAQTKQAKTKLQMSLAIIVDLAKKWCD